MANKGWRITAAWLAIIAGAAPLLQLLNVDILSILGNFVTVAQVVFSVGALGAGILLLQGRR